MVRLVEKVLGDDIPFAFRSQFFVPARTRWAAIQTGPKTLIPYLFFLAMGSDFKAQLGTATTRRVCISPRCFPRQSRSARRQRRSDIRKQDESAMRLPTRSL